MKVIPIPHRLASHPVCRGAAAALSIWLFSAAAAVAGPLPDWMTSKPNAKLLMLALDAGVGEANGALNFNGHHDGAYKIVVPQGWTVVVRMKNSDARVPHSALITKVYKQEEMPERLGPQDAIIPGAATPVPYTGTAAGGYAEFTFAAAKPGQYFIACGVHTHLQAGMWLRLEIAEGVTAPDWQHVH
jgi:sulfocyanin